MLAAERLAAAAAAAAAAASVEALQQQQLSRQSYVEERLVGSVSLLDKVCTDENVITCVAFPLSSPSWMNSMLFLPNI